MLGQHTCHDKCLSRCIFWIFLESDHWFKVASCLLRQACAQLLGEERILQMDGINPFIAGCTYLSELGPLPNLPWTPLEALKYKLEISVVTTSAQGMDGCVYVD